METSFGVIRAISGLYKHVTNWLGKLRYYVPVRNKITKDNKRVYFQAHKMVGERNILPRILL
jgi:hypothetical protein